MTKLFKRILLLLLLGMAVIQGAENEDEADDLDDLDDEADLEPTVMIVLLVRNKAHVLEYTLTMLEQQDYPKDRISLYVRSDHNEDNTDEILQKWLDAQTGYHSTNVIITKSEPNSRRHPDQDQGPLQWSDQRFRHIMKLKEEALEAARSMWADFVWFLDADAFIMNPNTLRLMTSRSHFTIAAPMLTTVGLYANFWAGMGDDFYYLRTDKYKLILDRKERGCHKVPMVHSSVVINLKKKESNHLTFMPENVRDYNGPEDDIIVFAISASWNGVDLHVCNDVYYGYIMLPLDGEQSLQDDLVNLSNLKIEMYAYGHRLPYLDTPFQKEKKTKFDSDNVYLINLDRRTDRRSNMEMIFGELGVDYERLPAVDGKRDLSDTYLAEHNIRMMADFTEPYHGRPLKLGEIGCFLSHYNIWQDVLAKGYDDVIVFEDDVRFEPFFAKKIAAVRREVADLGLDWDLIFLGRKILHNVEEAWVEDSNLLLHVNYTYWTLGYMLKASGARKLVDEQPLSKMVPVDEYLPIMYDRHPNATWKSHYKNRNLKAFSVHPLLLHPTHYTGEEGYISDTEDSNVIAVENEYKNNQNDLYHEEL